MGKQGNLAIHFANLIKIMWSGSEEKIYPVKFLKALAEYASHVFC